MNGVPPGLLLLMVPLLPALGAATLWGGAALRLSSSGRSVAALAAALSGMAIIAAMVLLGVDAPPLTLTIGGWMTLSGDGSGIDISLRWDRLSALWLLALTLAALFALAGGSFVNRAAGAWGLVVLTFVQLAVMAASYWQLFVCAEVASVAAWRFLCSASHVSRDEAAARRLLIWGLLSDLPLIVGLTALWQAVGTLDFAVVLDSSLSFETADGETSRIMVGFAAFCIISAGMARCAQFPFGHWLVASVASHGPGACLMACLGILPMGVFLLLRSLPLLAAQPAALTVLGNWGCLSALIWGAVVLTQPDVPRAAAAFAAGTLAVVSMALGLGGPSASAAAQYLAANLFVLTGVLLPFVAPLTSGGDTSVESPAAISAGSAAFPASIAAILCLAAALTSGIWGQEGVLRTLWAPSNTVDSAVEPVEQAPHEAAPVVLPVGALTAIAAHLLLSLGLFRAVLRSVPSDSAQPRADLRSRLPVVLSACGAVSAVPLAIGLRPQLLGIDQSAGVLAQLAFPGITSLLMLLALLLAWLLKARPQDVPAATLNGQNDNLSSLVRLSQRQFYVADACRLCIARPLALCGGAMRLLERHVWEQPLLRDACETTADDPPHAANHSHDHPAWPALCLVLAAAVVLILLLAGG